MGVTNFDIVQANSVLGATDASQGKTIYLVADATDTSNAVLRERGIAAGDVYYSASSAIAALRSGYNDTLYVMPGDHLVTAEINITQNQIRIIGLGGPNMGYTASTSTTANVGVARFKCVTASVAKIFHITGSYVTLIDIATFNSYDSAANVCDIYVTGRNFYALRCEFRGGNGGTTQMGANSGIPVVLASGYAPRFDDCKIGSPGNYTRTSGPGYLWITGGTAVGMPQFNNCIFCMRSETTGANATGILIDLNSLDRLLIFRGCIFYNFSVNWGALPDYMINDDETSTHNILFSGGCAMTGFDFISDSARALVADPIADTASIKATAGKIS